MNILVLCTGNSARSILAEVLLNHLGGERLTAHSARSQPAGKVHPQALSLLAERGMAIDNLRSKSWDEFAAENATKLDVVITVCDSAASETCPYWPGAPVTAHWGLPDPAAAAPDDQPKAFRTTYARLEARIAALLAEPFEALTPPALSALLSRIGTAP